MHQLVDLALICTGWAWAAGELLLQLHEQLSSERTERTERRSLVVLLALLAGGTTLATLTRHEVTALSYPVHGQVLRGAVLAVASAGIALRLWSVITLGRFFRVAVHIQHEHRVVSSGPYRWMRHPAYGGLLLAVLGYSVLFGNALSWLLIAACCLTAVGYRIHVEERMLLDGLGEEYRAYAGRTRRLIPGVW
ncbi:methyltransferase family protein [Streptomyces sp. NPDC053048]|uniref:methyltransferase family protein n=1 Tax=Streptomyces sp. NPDC053048 TaxID=3365694 RepID=UPI0037D0D13C